MTGYHNWLSGTPWELCLLRIRDNTVGTSQAVYSKPGIAHVGTEAIPGVDDIIPWWIKVRIQ